MVQAGVQAGIAWEGWFFNYTISTSIAGRGGRQLSVYNNGQKFGVYYVHSTPLPPPKPKVKSGQNHLNTCEPWQLLAMPHTST